MGNTDYSFGLSLEEMSQHVLIAGRSGSGKTTLLYHMINQLLEKNIGFWCFDFKREFRGLIRRNTGVLVLRPEDFRFNPLRPPGNISPVRWASVFSDVFGHSMGLLEGSESFLLDMVMQLYDLFGVFRLSDSYPSLHELMELLEHTHFPPVSRNGRYLEVVKNRVNSCLLTAGEMLNCDRDMMADLLDRNAGVVFEFYGLPEHVNSFLVEMMLAELYFHRMMLGRRKSRLRPLVVLIDEARNIYDYRKERIPSAGIPVIDTITERIREFGVSLVICTQIPSELCASAKANTYTKLMMNLGNGRDISDLANCMGLTAEQAEFSHSLEVGTAIVKLAGRYTRPFWIRIPHVTMEKDVPDYELEERLEELLWEFEVTRVSRPERYCEYLRYVRDGGREETLPTLARKMLLDIFARPFVPVTVRYESLGISRRRGRDVKEFLMKNGYVTGVNIRISNSVSSFLVLTRKGLALCREHGHESVFWREIVSGKVSFRHRFYQFLVASYLTREGWDVKAESRIGNGRVDLEAVRRVNGRVRRIAVEVVVTKFKPGDVTRCINDGFNEVWIVCRDESTRKRVKKLIEGMKLGKKADSVLVRTISALLENAPREIRNSMIVTPNLKEGNAGW